MGRRGPAPEPTALKRLKGNPGKRPLNDSEPRPAATMPRCPGHLQGEARAEWRREWGYSGVWRINTVRANDQHPAMFPVELPERCVKMHSDPGDLVLEPFCGSGTTIVACENLGRRCAAVEREPRYVAVALQRYEDAFGIRGDIVEG